MAYSDLCSIPSKGKTTRGDALRFLLDVGFTHEGEECLVWPYSCHPSGRANMRYRGRMRFVARIVCEEKHGPPPTPKHEAAHSCGKGHKGCISRSHLSWKTRTQNAADMIGHGTIPTYAGPKLTADHVRRIRALVASTSQNRIAVQFGVSQRTIRDILVGHTWRGVE